MIRREVKLDSGATLRIQMAPFDASKNLYQAILRELNVVEIAGKVQMGELYKNLFCRGFASPEIEACLWPCLKCCTYDDGNGELKIDKDSFEPVERRADFVYVCMEVAHDNVSPFMKGLYAEYIRRLSMVEKDPA